MSLENLNKQPVSKIEEDFLNDQKLQLTVEDDFSYFCKFDELTGVVDHPYSMHQKSDLPNSSEPSKEAGSRLIDEFIVEDDFSYFCMYDDLMGCENIPVEEEKEEQHEQSQNVPVNCDKKLNLNEIAQGFEILFGALYEIHIIDNIRAYFNGEITPNELLANTDKEAIYIIYRLINRVLNYRCKDTRYYIQLPVDIFFNTPESMASSYILACKLDESYKNSHMLNLIGPNNYKYDTRYIEDYLEIDGNFSQIPSGAKLKTYDYLQIMKKYPNILEHISYLMKTDHQFSHMYVDKSDDEMRQLALEHLQRWLGWYPKPDEDTSKPEENLEGVIVLSQETIDSITFVQPVEYVTLEEVKNGTFGTFEEILKRISDLEHKQNESVLKKKLQ